MDINGRENELKLSLKRGLYLRLSLLNVMRMSELKFYELIRAVESNPLYKLLSQPGAGSPPAIRRKRFSFAWEFSLVRKRESLENDSRYAFSDLAAGQEEVVSIIRKMGRRRFEKYFLYGSAGEEETAVRTGLDRVSIRRVKEFVDSFLLAGEAAPPQNPPAEVSSMVASLSCCRGRPMIEYVSPYYSSGIYEVNRRNLKKLRLSPGLKDRKKELNSLLLDISRLNFRKNLLDMVLRSLCEYQKEYICKGRSLRPLSMRKFSEILGVDVSVVSRAVSGKCVKLPSGETIRIKSFFLSRKAFTMGKISDILGKKRDISGKQLAALLLKETGLRIPVRTVNYYRSLMRGK